MYKEAKTNVKKLIKIKKRDLYQEKLRKNVGKPKELWKALKSLGLPSEITQASQVSLKEGEKISFDEKYISDSCNLLFLTKYIRMIITIFFNVLN